MLLIEKCKVSNLHLVTGPEGQVNTEIKAHLQPKKYKLYFSNWILTENYFITSCYPHL